MASRISARLSHRDGGDAPVTKHTVSKMTAAHRQLNAAISFDFQGADPIVVCTLAGAASRIFSDLINKRDPSRSWDQRAWTANKITSKEYFQVIRKAQDFLKHADKDPDDVLVLDELETEELLYFATLNAGEIDGISTTQQVFQLWYLASHAHYFPPNFETVMLARQYFPALDEMQREKKLADGLRALRAAHRPDD